MKYLQNARVLKYIQFILIVACIVIGFTHGRDNPLNPLIFYPYLIIIMIDFMFLLPNCICSEEDHKIKNTMCLFFKCNLGTKYMKKYDLDRRQLIVLGSLVLVFTFGLVLMNLGLAPNQCSVL